MQIADANRGLIPFELWPHLIERAEAWERGESEVILKARQVGVSWELAAYMVWRAQYQPGAVVLALSAGQLEAYELLGKARAIQEALPDALRRPLAVDAAGEMSFTGGGRIMALPATQKAGRGYTATLVVVDEAAFHPWAAANYGAYRPTVEAGGQLLMVSTANGAQGFFHDLYWASYRGETPYKAIFIPWSARPGRDADWLVREKSAFEGLPAEFDQEYPDSAAKAFISLTGLVYPQFSFERHVGVAPVAWEDCLVRMASYDLGGGDPTAIVMLGVWRDIGANKVPGAVHVHQYGEFYKKAGAPTDDEMADYIRPWHQRAPLVAIEGDTAPGGPVVAASLNKMLRIPIRMEQQGRGEGLGTQAMFLEQGWLSIDPSCRESIHEFAGYRWLQRVDPNSKDRYATATPHDHHGDAMDARRKALVTIYRQLFRQPVGQRAISYVRPKPASEMTVAERVVALGKERERVEREATARAF